MENYALPKYLSTSDILESYPQSLKQSLFSPKRLPSTTFKIDKPEVKEFFQQLGQLINLRIRQHIKKQYQGYETDFVNTFIMAGYDSNDIDKSILIDAAEAKEKFQLEISIELACIELEDLMLDQKSELVFVLRLYQNFLSDSSDDEPLKLILMNQSVQPFTQWQVDIFNDLDTNKMLEILTKVKQELMFGTLKGV